MFVSFVPFVLPVLLVGIPLLFAFKSRRAFLVAYSVSLLTLAAIILPVLIPGWILTARARGGDAKAQYGLSKWYYGSCRSLQDYLPWPCDMGNPNSYAWLLKAAKQDHPASLYALGVRTKYGKEVPRPADWRGPGGNVFDQPEKGQLYIDKAIKLGYTPVVEEELFYTHVYLGQYVDDPYD